MLTRTMLFLMMRTVSEHVLFGPSSEDTKPAMRQLQSGGRAVESKPSAYEANDAGAEVDKDDDDANAVSQLEELDEDVSQQSH